MLRNTSRLVHMAVNKRTHAYKKNRYNEQTGVKQTSLQPG